MAERRRMSQADRDRRRKEEEFSKLERWKPRTELGKKVKEGEISSIAQVLESGKRVLESEIIDTLLPDLESDFILIGQAKGKFGGGKRRVFRQTQKKTREGNKPIFSVMAVVGNRDGYVGVGLGKAKETMPAREKAVTNAKLNIFQISRGCGSWECTCGRPHTVPAKLSGKCGSITVTLLPAPRGTGLVVDKELKKLMKLCGIKDLWSKTKGQANQKINHVRACLKALNKSTQIHITRGRAKYGSIA